MLVGAEISAGERKMKHLVRLKYATTQRFAVGGVPGGVAYTYIRAKVRNAAFDKIVQAVYREPSPSGGWSVIDLTWMANFGNYDLFGRDGGFSSDEFAVFASVGADTDWDNYRGGNYQTPNFRSAAGGDVALNRAVARQGAQGGGGFTIRTSWFEGEIYVNNLSFAKRVGVLYTADGWASFAESDAAYAGPATEGAYSASTGAELWRFRTPELNYNGASENFEFTVYHQRLDTGALFWDNNFAQNYSLSKLSGATIE
jgi:hypothetical protein